MAGTDVYSHVQDAKGSLHSSRTAVVSSRDINKPIGGLSNGLMIGDCMTVSSMRNDPTACCRISTRQQGGETYYLVLCTLLCRDWIWTPVAVAPGKFSVGQGPVRSRVPVCTCTGTHTLEDVCQLFLDTAVRHES